jgi:hypothetical protein
VKINRTSFLCVNLLCLIKIIGNGENYRMLYNKNKNIYYFINCQEYVGKYFFLRLLPVEDLSCCLHIYRKPVIHQCVSINDQSIWLQTKSSYASQCKKSLKIPKGDSESVCRWRTDNTMAKRKSTKDKQDELWANAHLWYSRSLANRK